MNGLLCKNIRIRSDTIIEKKWIWSKKQWKDLDSSPGPYKLLSYDLEVSIVWSVEKGGGSEGSGWVRKGEKNNYISRIEKDHWFLGDFFSVIQKTYCKFLLCQALFIGDGSTEGKFPVLRDFHSSDLYYVILYYITLHYIIVY